MLEHAMFARIEVRTFAWRNVARDRIMRPLLECPNESKKYDTIVLVFTAVRMAGVIARSIPR
jgi:hypothetical protein